MTKHRGLKVALFPALAVTLAVGTGAPAVAQDHPWEDTSLPPEQRATLLLEEMTLEEKIQQIGIYDDIDDPDLEECVEESTLRTVVGIERLDMPTIRMTNAGTGIRGGSCQNPSAIGLPSSTTAAATFDPDLNHEYGAVLGEEARLYAHQVLLGPSMNLVRHPYGGRNHEYFSEDPFLSGAMAAQQVRGIQEQGVNAQIKHFVGNEQETERWTTASVIPSQALHELYLLPFEMSVKDGDAASLMCAFPHLNGDWACENQQLLRDTLYERWGFDGWIMSDRRATHSTADSILAGNGLELDYQPEFYNEEDVTAAIDAGEIAESDLDALLHPRYTKLFEYGLLDEPLDEWYRTTDWDPDDGAPVGEGDGDILLGDEEFYQENGDVARRVAEGGITLLKNEPAAGDEENLLPLDGDEGDIALIGHEWYGATRRWSRVPAARRTPTSTRPTPSPRRRAWRP